MILFLLINLILFIYGEECTTKTASFPKYSGGNDDTVPSYVINLEYVHYKALVIFSSYPASTDDVTVSVTGPWDVNVEVTGIAGNVHGLTVSTAMDVVASTDPGATVADDDTSVAAAIRRPTVAALAAVGAYSSGCRTRSAMVVGAAVGLMSSTVQAQAAAGCQLVVTIRLPLDYTLYALKVEKHDHLTVTPWCGIEADFEFTTTDGKHGTRMGSDGRCQWTSSYKRTGLTSGSSSQCDAGLAQTMTARLDYNSGSLSINNGPFTALEETSTVSSPYTGNGTAMDFTLGETAGQLKFMNTTVYNNVLVPVLFDATDGSITCQALYECQSGFCLAQGDGGAGNGGPITTCSSWYTEPVTQPFVGPADSADCTQAGFQQCRDQCVDPNNGDEFGAAYKLITTCPCGSDGLVQDASNQTRCDLTKDAVYYSGSAPCFSNWIKPPSVTTCGYWACASMATYGLDTNGQYPAPVGYTIPAGHCLCTPILENGGYKGFGQNGGAAPRVHRLLLVAVTILSCLLLVF